MSHKFEIHINAEGSKLAYLSPVDEEGESQVGYRIAGPKAWGGSTCKEHITITDDDMAEYIASYAPQIYEKLQNRVNDNTKEGEVISKVKEMLFDSGFEVTPEITEILKCLEAFGALKKT